MSEPIRDHDPGDEHRPPALVHAECNGVLLESVHGPYCPGCGRHFIQCTPEQLIETTLGDGNADPK
jgi:hypothetical protein